MQHYAQILVPLDGSKTAEAALPHAIGLAKIERAEVTLLLVVSPIEDVVAAGSSEPIYIDEQLAAKMQRASSYLAGVRERQKDGLNIRTAVESGPVAATIIDYAVRQSVDLIVLATHGRSGVQRRLLGSVAEKVLHAARQTVLLVRAFPAADSPRSDA